ncbi:hypothetical protein E3P99_00004 [Wallemia hederae]|uniref:C2H2-type domain-containing protein n=1 Tax=Wallemia hederae TaxID=1540922 RepID=A0A4T0FZ29_9BASI|nr:hypothetical protein E3P99_00004 [Wallemia hederae]
MFSVQSPPSLHQPATHRSSQQDFNVNPFDNILPLNEALIDFNGNKIFNDLEFINNLPKPVSPVITPLLTPQPTMPTTADIPLSEARPSTSEGIVRKPLQRSNTNTKSNYKYNNTLSLRTVDGTCAEQPPKQKRTRRRHDEIERFYHCGYNGCPKSYGTLNHLNAHVIFQKHGPKRLPGEFKEIRAYQKNRKKEEMKVKRMLEEEVSSVCNTTVNTPLTTPYDETLPILPNSAPPTQTSFSDNVQDIPDVRDLNDDDFLTKLREEADAGMTTQDLSMPFSAPASKTSFFGDELSNDMSSMSNVSNISNDENDTMNFEGAIQNSLSTLALPDFPETLSEALSLMDKQSTRSSSEDDAVSTADNMIPQLDDSFYKLIN